LPNRNITPGYILFFILFSPDTWRILIGVVCAALLGPLIALPEMNVWGKIVLYFMIATIGYAASAVPARWIARSLKKVVLGD
jgi:pilus assembly protein TadC